MNSSKRVLAGVVFWLDILATSLLVFILIGIWLFRDHVFTIGKPITLVGLTMLVGIGMILLFNIASIAWLSEMRFNKAGGRTTNSLLIGLGILCVVLMMAEKVMADEVAHETVGSWSIQTEYLMLYGMLVLQLIYGLLVGVRLRLKTTEPIA